MKVFIPSYGRAGRVTTHMLLRGLDWTLVVHSDAEADQYRKLSGIPTKRIVVSGVETGDTGLWKQRRFISTELADQNEWFVFADDNIRAFTLLPDPWFREERIPVEVGNVPKWRKRMKHTPGPQGLMEYFARDVERAERLGTTLVGFATTDNPLFRGNHYSDIGYVVGKAMLWKAEPELDWSEPYHAEDFGYTADRLKRHGAVLIDRFILPVAGHYEPGGMGRYAERIPARQESMARLMQRYPGLFRWKEREGFAPKSDLQLAIRSGQVDAWRKSLNADSTAGE